MKKILYQASVIILGCMVFCVHAQAQSQEVFEKHIKYVKEKTAFANWGKETNQVIPGLDISPQLLPRLKDLKSARPQANYVLEHYQKTPYVKISQWWKSEKDQLVAVMVVGPSFTAAKEYLLKQYVETQKAPALIKIPAQKFKLKIGNVCFVTTQDNQGETFSSLDFIRHNVIIMLTAEGELQNHLRDMAERLDALLMKHKSVKRYDQLPDIPKILSLALARKSIKAGDETPFTLSIRNPRDRKLHYDWKLSAGGVRQDHAGQFFYQGTEPGQQQIEAIVMNDLGLFNRASVAIKVNQ